MEVANYYFNYKPFVPFGFLELSKRIHVLKFHKGKTYWEKNIFNINYLNECFLYTFGWKALP